MKTSDSGTASSVNVGFGAMLRKALLLAIGAFAFSAVSVEAFDGVRKGFVIGGGLGIAANSHWEIDNSNVSEDKPGLGLNLLIGYAWDEHNMIVYEGNVTGYSSDAASTVGGFLGLGDQTITQGFNGAAWYHYYGDQGKSLFTAVGLGVYVFDVQDFDANDPGFGILLGLGYEFARHWQTAVYASAGKTTSGGFDFKHSHINVVMNVIAF
jgi:hypothetical protein